MPSSLAIGSAIRPLRVAIVGSGPAGFHTAMSLLERRDVVVAVDLLDRLPTPYGLVRAGVAPDHQKIKSVTRVYERLGSEPRFRFFGNVELGRDISVGDLAACYDQVVFATGNEADRRLGIPGEHLTGCVPATVFVGWYNAHPDYRRAQFDLGCERVVVIGNGNVALDVSRILLKPHAVLAKTDIAEHALRELARSQVREVVILGRRGPLQAAFAPAELEEVTEIEDVGVHVDPADLILEAANSIELAEASTKSPMRRNYELLSRFGAPSVSSASRHLTFRFHTSPLAFEGDELGRLGRLRVGKNQLIRDAAGELRAVPTGHEETIDVGLALVSVGSESKRIPGLPFDAKRGCIANVEGRVVTEAGEWLENHYCTGWARTGARGLIATQKAGALDIATRLLDDFRQGAVRKVNALDDTTFPCLLGQREIRWVSFEDWKAIDRTEIERGQARGAPRDKLVDVPAMIEVAEMNRRGW